MSNLKLPEMSFTNLRELLVKNDALDGQWVKLAYATFIRKADVNNAIEIRHHNSIIATVSLTDTIIDPHGFHTATTANRLNKIVYANTGMHVCLRYPQKNYQLYVRYAGTDTMRPINGPTKLYNKG
jgi:hypothetical protein